MTVALTLTVTVTLTLTLIGGIYNEYLDLDREDHVSIEGGKS